jgi:hypothetical protein
MAITRENAQVLNLIQAMIGSPSPNFRRVTLEGTTGDGVRLRFLLAHDDPMDREEIEEIAFEFEFETLQDADISIEVDVVCDAGPLADIRLPGRIVYVRRE